MSYRKQMGTLVRLMCLPLIIAATVTQPAFSMNEELLPSTSTDLQEHKVQYHEFSRTHSSTDFDLEENKGSSVGSFVTVNDDSLPLNHQNLTINNDVKTVVTNQTTDPYIFKSPYVKALLGDYYFFKEPTCLIGSHESLLCNAYALACFGQSIKLTGVLLLTIFSSRDKVISAVNIDFQTLLTLSELRNRRINLTCNTLCENPAYYLMTTVMFIAGVGGTIASLAYGITKDQDAYGTAFCCAFVRLALFAGWMTSYCGCQGASAVH